MLWEDGAVSEQSAAATRVREAARVLLVDEHDRVLLLEGRDSTRPDEGTWWFTPGGGIDDGETPEQAARREVQEETGIALDELGPVVHARTTEFDFEDQRYRQHEVFFLARLPLGEPAERRLSPIEERSLVSQRWWRPDELTAAGVTVYPEGLATLVQSLLVGDGEGTRR